MEIIYGMLVRVKSDDVFNGAEGIVMDTQSPLEPPDGPIAVFFGKGNSDILFDFHERRWKGEVPTKDNYIHSPRVRCFNPVELEPITEYSILYRASEAYGDSFHSLYGRTFPLVVGVHACGLLDCVSNKMATNKTLMNAWGTVSEFYTCEDCHKKWHGTCMDSYPDTKRSLPGAPVKQVAA